MIRTATFSVHHASFLTLKGGTVIMPVGLQELVFDQGALRFNLVQNTRYGPQVLARYPVNTIAKAGWY